MRRGLEKKGLSPVIASALLIALVLVLAAIIFLWARGFMREQIEKFGEPVQSVCEDVDFNVEFVQGVGNTGELDIANYGNVPIYNFDIKQVGSDGNSRIDEFEFSVGVGEASPAREISLLDNTEKIIVFPKVLGVVKGKNKNKPFTCVEYGKSIDL